MTHGWYGMINIGNVEVVQAIVAYQHVHQHNIGSRCYNALIQPKRGP